MYLKHVLVMCTCIINIYSQGTRDVYCQIQCHDLSLQLAAAQEGIGQP